MAFDPLRKFRAICASRKSKLRERSILIILVRSLLRNIKRICHRQHLFNCTTSCSIKLRSQICVKFKLFFWKYFFFIWFILHAKDIGFWDIEAIIREKFLRLLGNKWYCGFLGDLKTDFRMSFGKNLPEASLFLDTIYVKAQAKAAEKFRYPSPSEGSLLSFVAPLPRERILFAHPRSIVVPGNIWLTFQ